MTKRTYYYFKKTSSIIDAGGDPHDYILEKDGDGQGTEFWDLWTYTEKKSKKGDSKALRLLPYVQRVAVDLGF